ncbi:hypothetical protein Anas_11689 [Armadillidium nasatum]|uniref:Uncharacterized protein n=1 Tax=Armadillidium nasatum TaxID=96803 RepID=A0A5N5T637_9CRUS|nr:hypothetical protein Anas_11689 [Armadillidium nasatum]
MSSRTPSRISLRRKRLCNEFESNEPSPKRISPAKNDQLVSDQKKNEKKGIIETDKSLIATNMMTPKNYKKRGVKRNFQTPKTPRDIENTSLGNKNEATENEFSPSQSPSQFPSSQIPSTQDWEVVWDCNSPGYSKEELKKMGDDHSDKSFNSSPIASFPNRLFTKLKRRPLPLSPIHLPSRLNSKNSMAVAAELDSLLIKVNGERIQQLEEQSDDSEPLANDISNILNASSQPFDVSNLEEETLNHSVQNSKEKLEKDSVPHHEASVPLVKNEAKQTNSETNVDLLSFDDDDLFSESFLLSSQALEESMLKKEPETQKSNFTTNKSFSPLSRIRKKTPTVIDDNIEVKFEKRDNESTTTSPVKTKSLSSYKIGPDTSCHIPSKVSNTNKLHISSGVADSVSDNFSQNKAKTNLQNDFDASDLLNTKTNDKNFVKISGFKTNKPRATFQLNIPSSQSLHKLFTSKFSSSENRTSSCNKNEIDTSDNTLVINASNNEKYNRSKSESSHLSNNVTKIKSCNSLIESNFGSNVTQELDDDDEIFASFMPALIEVEAEHVKKLSQELKVKNEVSTATASCIQSSVNSFPKSSVSDQISFSFNNSQNQSSQLKPCNMQTKTIVARDENSIQNYNKSLCVDRFSKTNKPSSEKRAGISEVVTESCLTNQKSSSALDWKDQKFKTENKRSESLPAFADEFEDEDDDIFLQDGVLDYLTQVESNFISSQSSPQKSDAKPSTPVKESSSLLVDSANSLNKTENHENNVTFENNSAKTKLDKYRYEKSMDRGSKMLVKEFCKVSVAAAKLRSVLNCDSANTFKEKVVSKEISSRRSDLAKSPQNSENILSDEDMFSIAFETSIEDSPTKLSVEQNQRDKFPVSKERLQRNCSSSISNNNSNDNDSSMTNFQGRFSNTHNTRSRGIGTRNITQITLSNKLNSVSKPKTLSTINTRGASRFHSSNKSNNK